MDKLNSMQAFVAVAELKSFSGAAEALRMSKAMVSKHVSQLEQFLGTRLLSRSTRHLRLTEAGARYLEGCRAVLDDLHALEARIAGYGARPQGLLKVMAPTSFGSFHIAPLLAEFAESYPGVRIQLILADRATGLLEEGVDVALQIGDLEDSTLVARRIGQARLVTCAAPEYLARLGVPAQPGDLGAHNCLRYSEGSRRGQWLFRLGGVDRVVRVAGDFEASTGDAVRMAALAGHGLAQLPSYIVREDLASGRLVAVLENFAGAAIPIYAVYAHREASATVRGFIDLLAARFDETAAGGR